MPEPVSPRPNGRQPASPPARQSASPPVRQSCGRARSGASHHTFTCITALCNCSFCPRLHGGIPRQHRLHMLPRKTSSHAPPLSGRTARILPSLSPFLLPSLSPFIPQLRDAQRRKERQTAENKEQRRNSRTLLPFETAACPGRFPTGMQGSNQIFIHTRIYICTLLHKKEQPGRTNPTPCDRCDRGDRSHCRRHYSLYSSTLHIGERLIRGFTLQEKKIPGPSVFLV